MAQFQLGSIGTLKPEDLLPAFEHAYVSIYPDAKIPAFFDSLNEHLQSLIEAINYHCPPFVYFGTLPGDGADFGFWPDWDALDAPRPYWDAKRTIKLDQGAKVLIQFDIGGSNVTVMDLDRNVLWATV